MHGVKIPDTATPDDKPSEELPYMEMLYRFVFGPKSYYNLEITKDVKPQANNRQSEEAAPTTDTTGENEPKAQKDEARTLPVRGLAVTERPQQVLNNILIHSILR